LHKKWASKVLESAGSCRRLLGIVRLIPKQSADKVIAIAALMEVTAAEWFKWVLGYFEDLIDQHHSALNNVMKFSLATGRVKTSESNLPIEQQAVLGR
jgi:hypothetical protein